MKAVRMREAKAATSWRRIGGDGEGGGGEETKGGVGLCCVVDEGKRDRGAAKSAIFGSCGSTTIGIPSGALSDDFGSTSRSLRTKSCSRAFTGRPA